MRALSPATTPRLPALARLPAWLYALPLPGAAHRRMASAWLALGVVSLVLSGVYSVLLVLSRAPYVKDVFPLVDFFHTALVLHVDLSVLVWFLAFAGVFWSLNSTARWMRLGWAALALCVAGTAILAAAPFLQRAAPVMSNYIPVLDGSLFLGGLLTFAAGFGLLTLRSMAAVPAVGTRPDGAGALRFGLNASVVSAAVALMAFVWSYLRLPPGLEGKAYYELLFWGGGHVVQFTYTLLMFVAWLWLAGAIGARVPLKPRTALLLFVIALAAVFATPVIYLALDITSVEHHRWLTWMMQFGGGLAILPFALATLAALAGAPTASPAQRPLKAALIASLALFGTGGLIALDIDGSNVKIPAHYHGCIVGVTLAFMGVAYHLLPRLGWGAPRARLATWQCYLYSGGQLLHILGLVWSGGYGVQRKVAGSAQVLEGWGQKAGMGLMGLGGLIAVIGGLLFIVVVLEAVRRRGSAAEQADEPEGDHR
ncbi:MAG: cbb3-type cytochrome c oxidase subunit I [Pseudomonadota bacterium]